MKKVLFWVFGFMLLLNISACRADLERQRAGAEYKTHYESASKDVALNSVEYWVILIGGVFVLVVTLCPHLHDKGWHKKDRDR